MRPGLKAREGVDRLHAVLAQVVASMRPGLKAREGSYILGA